MCLHHISLVHQVFCFLFDFFYIEILWQSDTNLQQSPHPTYKYYTGHHPWTFEIIMCQFVSVSPLSRKKETAGLVDLPTRDRRNIAWGALLLWSVKVGWGTHEGFSYPATKYSANDQQLLALPGDCHLKHTTLSRGPGTLQGHTHLPWCVWTTFVQCRISCILTDYTLSK